MTDPLHRESSAPSMAPTASKSFFERSSAATSSKLGRSSGSSCVHASCSAASCGATSGGTVGRSSPLATWRTASVGDMPELAYGWWGDEGPPLNLSLAAALRSGAWRLARYGRALDNLLRLATVDPSKRVRPVNSWQVQARPHKEHDARRRPARQYFGLLEYCRGDPNATSFA